MCWAEAVAKVSSHSCRCVTSIRTRSMAAGIRPWKASVVPVRDSGTHHVGPHIDPWLYRATGGRWPSILGGVSTAPLMTTGAKSGQPREHQITYFHDGPDPIVTASNYGGPKHPQWYYNLKAHPECELGDEKFLATEVTDPDELRTPLWTCGAGLRRVERLSPEDRADWPSYPRLSAQTALTASTGRHRTARAFLGRHTPSRGAIAKRKRRRTNATHPAHP